MKVVSWNIRKSKFNSLVWKVLSDISPDLILLQEVIDIPIHFRKEYNIEFKQALTKRGFTQKFGTAILVKGKIHSTLHLISNHDWVNQELKSFTGNLIASVIQIENQEPINVVSVYSPAWPVSAERLIGIDVSDIKLKQNSKVWCTELLWSALKNSSISINSNWIIGGDFNSSETFDYMWKGGPSGNKEIIDRMYSLGLTECLKTFTGKLTPTFKNPKGGKVIHQIDHLYISNSLYKNVRHCSTGDADIIFGNSLSDHLPIIVEF